MQITFDPTNPAEYAIVSALLKAGACAAPLTAGEAGNTEKQARTLKVPKAETVTPKAEAAEAPAPIAEPKTEKQGAGSPAPVSQDAAPGQPAGGSSTGAAGSTPAPAPTPAAEGATLDAARKALVSVGETLTVKLGNADKARESIIALLQEVGAKTIHEVKPDQYGTLVKRAGELLAQHGAA